MLRRLSCVYTNEALNFLKTTMVFCNDNVNKRLYKVQCVSGTFNELGDSAWGTIPLAFPTSALSFCAVQNSAQLKSLELSSELGLF